MDAPPAEAVGKLHAAAVALRHACEARLRPLLPLPDVPPEWLELLDRADARASAERPAGS